MDGESVMVEKIFYGRVEYVVTRHAHNVQQRIQTPSLLPVSSWKATSQGVAFLLEFL